MNPKEIIRFAMNQAGQNFNAYYIYDEESNDSFSKRLHESNKKAIHVTLEELRTRLEPYEIEDGDGMSIRTRRDAIQEIDLLLNEL